MKRILWVCLLAFGLILSWSLIYAADFYVIPAKKKNFAPPGKTGQKDCYYDDGTTGTCTCGITNCPSSQDGGIEKGVTWPTPRFTDNSNGTVTDNLTGLIWMKNAKCQQFFYYDYSWKNKRTWGNAIKACDLLSSNSCGLSDGSSAGDWRLPNVKELQSLIDFGYLSPALSDALGTGQCTPGDPFNNVELEWYWSSSTFVSPNAGSAWVMQFYAGHTGADQKSLDHYVWCVRGGN